MNGYGIGAATIPSGGSSTAGININSGSLIALVMPVAFTGNQISFLVSVDGVNYSSLYIEGNEFVEPVAVNQYVIFDRNEFQGITWLKIRSGTAEAPVNQTYDATFELIGVVGAVQPNPRRTIDVDRTGCVGTFPSYWSTDDDVATFDLTFVLATGEIPSTIVEFDLQPEGSCGATDPSPDLRILGTASVSGDSVSQRFGNWQPDIIQIIYRVNLVCLTSFGNTISVYAFVVVNQPPELG